MDCESEGNPQRADSQALQDPEGLPEAGDEDGLSESFQLLQMDVEYDPQEKSRPANSAAWSSKNVQRKQRHWERIVSSKKSKRKQERERRKAKRAEDLGNGTE